MKKYFTYILTNFVNTVLYTGVTNNLERRIYEHKSGINISSFCAKCKVDKLVWFQKFTDVEDAIRSEKMIKGWKRDKKIAMIVENNPKLVDLMENREDSSPEGSE